jgi:tetratricopeptide (TPR) repeat protein
MRPVDLWNWIPTPQEVEVARAKAQIWIESDELRAKGEHVKAKDLLETATAKYPGDSRLLRSLAEVYAELGDDQNALALYEQYFQRKYPRRADATTMDNDPCVNTGYGEALLAAGRKAEAFAAFKRAVDKVEFHSRWSTLPDASPPNQSFRTIRAAAHQGSAMKYGSTAAPGYFARGIAELKKAMEIDPDYEMVRLRLALVLIGVRDDEKLAQQSQPLFQQLMKSENEEIRKIATDYNGRIELFKSTQHFRDLPKGSPRPPERMLTKPSDPHQNQSGK